MNKNHRKFIAISTILLITLITSGCKEAAPEEPTIDPNVIYTSAAETVAAQLTQDTVAQQPTLDPMLVHTEAAQTIEAKLTKDAPAQPVAKNTIPGQAQTAAPGQPLNTVTPIVIATLTSAPLPQAADKFELIAQEPADGTVITKEHEFDMVWTIKNTGTTTWDEEYSVVWFDFTDRIDASGTEAKQYFFREVVLPGETTNIIVDMFTSAKSGEYYSWWKIKNNLGQNFGDLDVTIIVVSPDAPPAADTATPTVTATP
ncbi:MAG: hypothetical protein JEZ06_22125 [Anaerolineaceae bacterium]|nr:hypothetical protein [Anaerolineaceae bacterium]